MKKSIIVLLVVLAIIGIAAIGIAVSKNCGNGQGQNDNSQGQNQNNQGQNDNNLGRGHPDQGGRGCAGQPDGYACHGNGVKCDSATVCYNGQCICTG
jgi:hypothetical protein